MRTRKEKIKDRLLADDIVSKEDLFAADMEFLEGYHVICADIYHSTWDESDSIDSHIVLKKGYTESEFQFFIDVVSHRWKSLYVMQYLCGTIWCSDGVWFESTICLGVTEWEKKTSHSATYPPIPKKLC